MEFFFLRTERDENQFISDWGMLVRSICLLCWKLMRSQTPGVSTDPSRRLCATRLFCTNPGASCWEFLCDRRDFDLPAACQRHTGTADTPGKCPTSCSSGTETIQTRKSLQSQNLSYQDKGAPVKKQFLPHFYRQNTSYDTTEQPPAHLPTSLLLYLRWLAQVHALSKQQGETLHSIP